MINDFIHSGCRESNPVYTHPMGAYYRYTTARNVACMISLLPASKKLHEILSISFGVSWIHGFPKKEKRVVPAVSNPRTETI